MRCYSGYKEAKVRLDVQSGNETIMSYTDPGTIYAPAGTLDSPQLTHICGMEEIQNQQTEIDAIHEILAELGFNDKTDDSKIYDFGTEHTHNAISMLKEGINFNLYRRERTECVYSTGIKNPKIASLLNAIGLSILDYQEWIVSISELYYTIKADGTDETYETEVELASNLHTRLQEEYHYRTKDLQLSTRRDYLDFLRLTMQ